MKPHKLKHLDTAQLYGGRLQQHQAEGIEYMAATTKTLCADPTGAGKTIQAAGLIAHAVATRETAPSQPVLWLTEGEQLAHQTAGELARFLPGLLVRGPMELRAFRSPSRTKQREALSLPAEVKVLTYDQWLSRGHQWHGPMSALILDEVSALKGGGAAYRAVLPMAAGVERVHMFSATPYENDPLEVWRIYSLLHLSNWPSIADFERNFVDMVVHGQRARPHGWISAGAAEYVWQEYAANHTFRRDWALEALTIPQCHTMPDWWVPLTPPQAALMAAAERNLRGLPRHIEQKKILTGGAGTPSARAIETAKLVDQLLARDRTAKLLVIGDRHDELDTAVAELTARGIRAADVRGGTKNRATVVEDFRADPDCPVLVGSQVLERGLNLQFCRYLISVGLSDNPARVNQQIGRIVRHASPFETVEHYTVLAECEYDRKAAKRVMHKEEQAAMFLPANHMPIATSMRAGG